MNCSEWKLARKSGAILDWSFYAKTREIQKSLQYNSDPNAKVIHHLRDTEEQRKYNDEHYELWGHNLDGSFEYGKYVIFVTEEWHSKYHSFSEETRKVMSENTRAARDEAWIENQRQKHLGKKASDETRKKMSESHKAQCSDPEFRKNMSEAAKKSWTDERKRKFTAEHSGENASMYGKHHSQETKEKLSGENNGMYGKHHTEEARANMSKNRTGERNGMYGKKGVLSSVIRRKKTEDEMHKLKSAIEAVKTAYKVYKENNGTLSWNDFRKEFAKLKSSQQSSDS